MLLTAVLITSCIPHPQYFSVQVNTEGSGTVERDPDDEGLKEGSVLTLRAIPEEFWFFDGWYDTEGLIDDDALYRFTIREDREITARFTQVPSYSLTVSVSGEGSVTKSPDLVTYREGTQVALTAEPDTGHDFTGWYIGSVLVTSDNPYTITIAQDVQSGSRFQPLPHRLLPYRTLDEHF